MKLSKLLTSRAVLCAINVVVSFITLSSLYTAWKLLFNLTNDFNLIEDILDGMGVIFIAYGVALEERDTLMKFFGLYPQFFNSAEDTTDHLSHVYGLFLLLAGLFMEVSVEIVKLPNAIFNTKGIEWHVFAAGLVFCMAALFVLLTHSYLLIRINRTPSEKT